MVNKDIRIFEITAAMADRAEGLLLPEAAGLIKNGMPIIAFGAALDEEVVGAVAGSAGQTYFDIISLYVHPGYRRKRIGEALMSEVEELIRDEGLFMRAAYTLQNEDNEALGPFLEFFGFEPEEAIYPAYFTAQLKDLSLRIRASEAVAYDIRLLSEFDDLKKRVLANDCIERDMPLPEGGFFSIDNDIGVISLKDGKISGYALSGGKGDGKVMISAIWSAASDNKELSAMLTVLSGNLKKKNPGGAELTFPVFNEEAEDFIRQAVKTPLRASFNYIKDPDPEI